MTQSNIAVPAASLSSTAGQSAGAASPGRLALWVMLSGTFLVVLDFFIVNVALPSMQHELLASTATLQLVVAGYGLATAAGLITGGRLGDLFGRRRMFMAGLLLFTLASAACGLAPNAELLVAARVLQGLAGALLQPQVLAMIGLVHTGEDRARAFAAYGLTLGLGATLGQLVGGLLIQADLWGLGWRSCFLINLPIGLLALLLAPRVIPPLANGGHQSRLDPAGMLLVAAASVAVVLPLVEGRQQGWPLWSWLCLAAALPLALLFAFQQRRLAARGGAPLVAPVLMADARFVNGLLTTLAFYVGNASLYFVLALYLQQGLALGALRSGLVFTALALGFFATSMGGARIARRFGGKPPIALGALLLAAGRAAVPQRRGLRGPCPPARVDGAVAVGAGRGSGPGDGAPGLERARRPAAAACGRGLGCAVDGAAGGQCAGRGADRDPVLRAARRTGRCGGLCGGARGGAGLSDGVGVAGGGVASVGRAPALGVCAAEGIEAKRAKNEDSVVIPTSP